MALAVSSWEYYAGTAPVKSWFLWVRTDDTGEIGMGTVQWVQWDGDYTGGIGVGGLRLIL